MAAGASGRDRRAPVVLSVGTVNADFLLDVDEPLERGGADELAEQALAGPRAAGVQLPSVSIVAGVDTGLVAILVSEGGAKTMILAPGANDMFSRSDGDRLAGELRRAPDGSALVADTELSTEALMPALETARDSARPTVLDPTRPERVSDRLLDLSDHVMPNADETARLTGIPVDSPTDARRAAQRLRERGAHHVHVRLPGGGSFSVWPDGDALLSPPADLEVVDTTGAGDAFAGTLATAIIAAQGAHCRVCPGVIGGPADAGARALGSWRARSGRDMHAYPQPHQRHPRQAPRALPAPSAGGWISNCANPDGAPSGIHAAPTAGGRQVYRKPR